jgi:hypothetical protein
MTEKTKNPRIYGNAAGGIVRISRAREKMLGYSTTVVKILTEIPEN